MNDDIFKIDIDSMVTESADDVLDISIDDNYNENGHEESMEHFYKKYETNTRPDDEIIHDPEGHPHTMYGLRNEETRKKVAEWRAKNNGPFKESAENISISLAGTKDQPPEDAYNANLTKLRKSFNDALDAFEAYSKKRK